MFEEIPQSRRFGYIRVCSKSCQDIIENELKQFLKKNILKRNIKIEIASAASKIEDRPIFFNLLITN